MPNYILNTSRQMAKRHGREKRFKWYGRIAIFISIAFLIFMFSAIVFRGASAFQQTKISLDINFSEAIIDPTSSRDPEILKRANYKPVVLESL
jgi:phosphate transport system permease protein